MSMEEQNIFLQYVAAFCAGLGSMALGTATAFTGPVGPLLLDKNATLVLSEGELSFFSSSFNLGAMAGSFVGGYLMSTFGRRSTMMYTCLPFFAGWIVIAFSQNFVMLLCGRLIHGFLSGIIPIVVPTYIGEIASPRIRGKLGSVFLTMVGVGFCYTSIVGALIKDLPSIAFICLPITIMHFASMYFLPESPVYLMSKGRVDEMENALKRLNGINYDIREEVASIKEIIHSQRTVTGGFLQKLSKFKSPSAYKPLIIIICLYFFMHFSGIAAMIFNLNLIFQDAGSDISPDLSSIIYNVLYTSGCVISGVLIDRIGRRILCILSSIGTTLSLGALGAFYYITALDEEWKLWTSDYLFWLPLLSLFTFVITFIVGLGNVPFVLAGEIFNVDLIGISGSIVTFFLWLFTFVVTVSFFTLKASINDYGVYWLYAGFMFLSFFFSYFYVPETTGKTKEEIAKLFADSTPIDVENAKNVELFQVTHSFISEAK